MNSLKELLSKYKGVTLYLIFGVLTTLVNIVAYWGVAHLMNIATMPSTVVAWVLAVLFAYFTNRKWVFDSTANTSHEIVQELLSFFACRLATGVVDWGCMLVFVDLLGWNDVIIKTAANVLVIVLNYVASKLIIFKEGK